MLNPKQWFCSHKETVYVKEIDIHTKQVEHLLVCLNCFKTITKYPATLTRASGVYERIDKRLEQVEELTELVRRAEEYQKEQQLTTQEGES